MIANLAAEWAFYQLVEKPSQSLSSRIRYDRFKECGPEKELAILPESAL
jgi:hypothetical protein